MPLDVICVANPFSKFVIAVAATSIYIILILLPVVGFPHLVYQYGDFPSISLYSAKVAACSAESKIKVDDEKIGGESGLTGPLIGMFLTHFVANESVLLIDCLNILLIIFFDIYIDKFSKLVKKLIINNY